MRALSEWAAALRWDDLPRSVRERLHLVLLDTIGVTVLGHRQAEQRAIVDAWAPPPGPSPLFGPGITTTVDAAAWLNAVASVRLELDEGNKFAKGHPAAHGFHAVLALAAERDVSGPALGEALVVAYEVASRFGRATTLPPGAHPHGNWGVAGAAAGCARLLGLPASQVAAAIDTGASLGIVGPFAAALDGNPVRDAWMGASNASGLVAARMAAAGVARDTGLAGLTVTGSLDTAALTEQLGTRFDIERGYFKRHAACSFTHPAADAALELAPELGDPARVEEIIVETHSLAAGLSRTSWDSRLAAMFSIPFVVATALVHGRVGPAESAADARDLPAVRDLAARVVVREAPDLTARLPAERATRVVVRSRVRSWTAEVPNPVGDADHHPFEGGQVVDMLGRWLPDIDVTALDTTIANLLAGSAAVCDLTPLTSRNEDTCASSR